MIDLSFCFTTYQRVDLTIKAVNSIIDDNRVKSIVVVDDFSEPNIFDQLFHYFRDFPKVDLYRNKENLGMSLNKKRAIELSPTEWVVIGDSDNEFSSSYIDALEAVGELKEDTIYMPNAALPKFVFSEFDGLSFNKETAKNYLSDPMFRVSLNTANYVVNRAFYCKVYQYNPKHLASDTIWHNYQHLKAGGNFYIVPNMNYSHLISSDSGFLKDLDINMANAEEVKNLIAQL